MDCACPKSPSIWLGFVFGLLLLTAAPLARGSTVYVDPGPLPPLPIQQKARITVLVDGNPLAALIVDILQRFPTERVARLTSDARGNVVLPELPPGEYIIGVASPNSPQGSGRNLTVCIVPCSDDGLETTVLVAGSLDGGFYAIDRNARALSDVRFEINPRTDPWRNPTADPSWTGFITDAEQQPILSRLPVLRGVVQDQAGAFIPGAWIDVRVKGTGGKKPAAMVRSDNTGKFDIHLPDGDYVGLVSSPGFQTRAFLFTISSTSPVAELPIVLEVGSVTEVITLS